MAGVIGVEIGGTKLQVAQGDGVSGLTHKRVGRVDVAAGAEGVLAWVQDSIAQLLAELPEPPTAIGVGFGGPVDSATGRVLTSHQVAGWQGRELKSHLEDIFRLPTTVANDSNAAGWAEYVLGAGRGSRNFVYMNIGSGIGGALVVDGKLYDGQGLGACEIGHTYLPDWEADYPGAARITEQLCSGWAIERRMHEWNDLEPASPLARLCGGDPARLTCAMLGQAAQENDQRALNEIQRVGEGVARTLANVIALLHPEVIALGGGVALIGDVLLEAIRIPLADYCFAPYRGKYKLVPCALGEDVVLQGAILLAMEAQPLYFKNLVAKITPHNLHEEANLGPPMGRELL